MNITITKQDHATILAALRYYQQGGMGEPDNRTADIHDIATNGDQEISLDDEGIDDLCERLDAPAEPVRVLIHLDGGLVQDVLSNTERMQVVIIDYDTEGADEMELTPIPQDGKYAGTTEDACARITTPTLDPAFIANAIKAIEDRDAELDAMPDEDATP